MMACGSAPLPVATPAATPSATGTAAAATGCGQVARMPDLGRTHINSQSYPYPQHPATSGPHYPEWYVVPPQVFATAIQETRAVHNLEHGYVIVYYSAGSEAPLAPAVVATLAGRVNGQHKVLMAPYPQLPPGSSLALAAWDELQLCDSTVTPELAKAALDKFIASFREAALAPESAAP